MQKPQEQVLYGHLASCGWSCYCRHVLLVLPLPAGHQEHLGQDPAGDLNRSTLHNVLHFILLRDHHQERCTAHPADAAHKVSISQQPSSLHREEEMR